MVLLLSAVSPCSGFTGKLSPALVGGTACQDPKNNC